MKEDLFVQQNPCPNVQKDLAPFRDVKVFAWWRLVFPSSDIDHIATDRILYP